MAVIGAYMAPFLTNQSQGKAYIYVKNNGSWTASAILQNGTSANAMPSFGISVALSSIGDIVSIGEPSFGRAYIFAKPPGGWANSTTPTATFIGSANDKFGCSVALSGDGAVALIGAYSAPYASPDVGPGRAYIFNMPVNGWSGNINTPSATFIALSGSAYNGSLFGYSVALSNNADTVLIGGYRAATGGTGPGQAYIFTRSGSSWSGTITTPTATFSGQNSQEQFGYSVAISSDGNTALIGAPFRTINGYSSAGAAYIFTKSGTWASTSAPTAILTIGSSANYDYFGYSVTINYNGSMVLIGAPNIDSNGVSDSGAAYIFTKSGAWATTNAPTATLAISAPVANDQFGQCVAISSTGDIALIGTPDKSNSKGAAYIFT
jgi:hypothetical protein